MNEETTTEEPKKKGWAALTPEQRREMASRGGKAAHANGKAHRFTKDEARAAGSKGGKATQEARRAKA